MSQQASSATADIQSFINEHFPGMEGLAVAAATVGDYRGQLTVEERTDIANAVERRQREFAAGRFLARKAMEGVGIAPGPIQRADGRAPVWPGCVGSISHTSRFAAAAVARPGALRGVGLDLEEGDRVVPELHRKLYTEWERERYGTQDARWPELLFSAKEAAYKAVNPIVGRFIGFQEVEIDVDWANHRFAVRYVGEHAPNKIMDVGVGRFGFFADHVISLLVVP